MKGRNKMGKLMDIYKSKKEKNPDKIYMFKGGVFYYFLDEDALYISDKYKFKLTDFGETVKCGFPIKAIEKYLHIFANEHIELVSEEENKIQDKIINTIKGLDLNEITPKDAYVILNNLKELINE